MSIKSVLQHVVLFGQKKFAKKRGFSTSNHLSTSPLGKTSDHSLSLLPRLLSFFSAQSFPSSYNPLWPYQVREGFFYHYSKQPNKNLKKIAKNKGFSTSNHLSTSPLGKTSDHSRRDYFTSFLPNHSPALIIHSSHYRLSFFSILHLSFQMQLFSSFVKQSSPHGTGFPQIVCPKNHT